MPGHLCDGDRAGNLVPPGGSPERISVVSYFRTKMAECKTQEEENAQRLATWEERNQRKMGATT